MAAGAVIAAAAAAAKRRIDDAAAITKSFDPWSRLAKERGLGFSSASGAPVLEGTLLGVQTRAWIALDKNGFGFTTMTANALAAIDGHVGVIPNPGGALGFLKHHLTQDVPVGEPEFDDAFLVRAKPTALAPALLGPALRAYLAPLAHHRLASFVYDVGVVTIAFPVVVIETEWVAAALDAAVEAARFTPPTDSPFR